ncbi:MAG TPA: DUF2752 domain-containing protein [Verrucomicrobiae bacterium]|jgi:hypothetical protein|nr:DUF2752 domain-containing protein [Verrucomicrobiae bacterium]
MSPLERRLFLWASLAGLAAACAVVFLFDPEQYHFYPVCVFHQATGWDCPGCGGLRAAHQLLHGHIAAAWRFNPLAVLLAPAAAWFYAREIVRDATGKILPGCLTQPVFLWTLVPAFVLFGILRNVW